VSGHCGVEAQVLTVRPSRNVSESICELDVDEDGSGDFFKVQYLRPE
jgi:hypothetical protein